MDETKLRTAKNIVELYGMFLESAKPTEPSFRDFVNWLDELSSNK